MFDTIATLTTAQNVSDLYNTVLVDTPLGMVIPGLPSWQ
jgi:hypothetical protein